MAFNGTVRIQLNGTWTNLTYNSSTGAYEGTVTAPGRTSFNNAGGVYIVTAEATNTAGTKTTKTANLTVKETVKPVITITSPSNGAYVINNKQPIVFTMTDEENGSGIKESSLVVKIDGTAVTGGITKTVITNGFSVTVTPGTLSDGAHTVTVDVQDNDGNKAAQKSTTFTVDTVPPVLNITSPADNLITNQASCVVAGTTNDATSSPVTLTVNGNTVTVNADGSFSKTITLAEGSNTITVKSVDKASKETTVVRHVTLDTSVPTIDNITLAPNPANTGATMTIKVTVS
ncbi:Uncharacterised protein [uncultured Eubacterium sp.]|nr:Uncharacterised protein [uncultured Eubacterium sp.]